MSRYVLKGELKGDYIGFDGNKGRLADIISVSKEAYKLYTEYEEKLYGTLLFNKVYSDNANALFYDINQRMIGAEYYNKKDEIRYNIYLSLYDVDNEEIVDRCEEYLTYECLQEFIHVLNKDWLKELKNAYKDSDLLQDMYDNVPF